MKKTFEKTWEAGKYESELYNNWEKSGYFKPEFRQNQNVKILPADASHQAMQAGKNQNDGKTIEKSETDTGKRKTDNKFVISMPPPNVTGKLHLGHALVVAIEDILTRYHRLIGEEALWVPGTDHAGIATQTVVEKELKKKGINRRELGRGKFVEEVWKWKEEYGGIITQQLRRLGASCDWSRERFTLDEGLSKAVNEAFVNFYNKGLIYRGEYIVNWCPRCHTAIADDEVEYRTQSAKLYFFKYDKDFPITIATTRPETKLGDTAVAVNPSDERYKQYVGQEFDIDLDGVKRKIKIVADRAIDKEFGTGAVGVTPAHSAVDWKIAEEQGLSKIKVIDEQAKIINSGEKYDGLKVLEAREKLVEYLKSNGLLEKEETIENNLSVCYRCETPIEPIPSLQWFVKMKPLAEKARKAVESGEIKFIPERFEKVYFHWLDNIRDWCISRQLWWGHRIPVYYRKQAISNDQFPISNENSKIEKLNENWQMKIENSNIYVGTEPPKDAANWIQDEDVLDTWFSSGLWPFSALGWPNESSPDFQKYYPTTVMETGYDILFFWVARMIMMGLELTGKVPFETVYLHGLVRDEHNRKMSKSLGNVFDPLDFVEKYGTDALRMALVVGTSPGQDMPIGEAKIKGFRNFTNKIWNASRFVALRVSDGDLQLGELGEYQINDLEINTEILTDADKEILKVHEEIKGKVKKYLDEYKFSLAGEALYEYFWHQFCDKYIESAKEQLQNSPTKLPIQRNYEITNNEQKSLGQLGQLEIRHLEISDNTKKILLKVLSETLAMLHPYVPFVTEAVWQELRQICPTLKESIMIADWPMKE